MKNTIPFQGHDCRHFSGYKPCFPGEDCSDSCQHPAPFGTRILIINLDAMGDVLMTTAQLPAIKRSFPESTIFWITLRNASPLLKNNPYIDEVFEWNSSNRLILQQHEFDLILNADKSKEAAAFAQTLRGKELRGFTSNRYGQIIPANPEAQYNYQLGLNDHLKFRVNQKTGQEILAETWRLPYQRDEYVLHLTQDEMDFCNLMRQRWELQDDELIVGFNTGCSELYPNKKMTIEQHIKIISTLSQNDKIRIFLLGGKEDTERNEKIYQSTRKNDMRIINTPTSEGVRRGLCYIHLCDAVVSGDSFGMHAAIALKKYLFVWFGVSCRIEVDLYDRGKKYIPDSLFCSPCWKKKCPYNLECISMIDLHSMSEDILSLHFQRKKME